MKRSLQVGHIFVQPQQDNTADHVMSNYHDSQCCLVEAGRRCGRLAGNASYSKRIQKTVTQRKLKLHMDNSVSLGCFRGNEISLKLGSSPILMALFMHNVCLRVTVFVFIP
jgi:hypothetical protein